MKSLSYLILLFSLSTSASNITPIDVKAGEWKIIESPLTKNKEMMKQLKVQQEKMKKMFADMPPEQAAMLKEKMKAFGGGGANPMATGLDGLTDMRVCIKEEDLKKENYNFGQNKNEKCKVKVIKSTKKEYTYKHLCPGEKPRIINVMANNNSELTVKHANEGESNSSKVVLRMKWFASKCSEKSLKNR